MSPLYEFSVPVFVKSLGGLKLILEKTAVAGLDEATLLADSLAPDMFPFVRQVQIACDNAKGAVARLSGQEVPAYPDTETTITELLARVEKTLTFVQSVTQEQYDGAEERVVTLPYFPEMYMTGHDYLQQYVLANFYFHLSMAYAIARKNGVPLGKPDFLNGLPLRPVVV